MRARERPQLSRCRVGAGDRDADGQTAAFVRVTADSAVLVPRDVGDPFGDPDRLEQCLDAVACALLPELVTGLRDRRKVEEPRVFQERPGAVRLAVESLHADEAGVALGRARPPRTAVAFGIGGRGAVHVGRDRVHLRFVEQALDVEEPGGLEEVPHLVTVVVGVKRAGEVERASVAVVEGERSRRIDGRAVERGAQDEPPVEQMADIAGALLERSGGPQAHERLLVVGEVGELLAVEPHVRRRVAPLAALDHDAPIIGGERPYAGLDLHHGRSWSNERQRGRDRVHVLLEPQGKLLVEEALGIELGAGSVYPAAYVDRHGSHARPSRRCGAKTPGRPARSRRRAVSGLRRCLVCRARLCRGPEASAAR